MKISVVWPNSILDAKILEKIVKLHYPDIIGFPPLVGGITNAFLELKEHINNSIEEHPCRYIRVTTEKGTTTEVYETFLLTKIISSFGVNEPHRKIIQGNLSSHMGEFL